MVRAHPCVNRENALNATWTERDLSPALGALRLTGCVAWARLQDTEQTLEGDRRSHYESGIEFTGPTPEQQAALTAALATLQAARATPNREASR